MFFAKGFSLSALIGLCRSLRHNLGAGLTLRDVFRQQADRGVSEVRPVAQRIRETLEQGDSLEVALQKEKATFPPLFLAMAGLGEETGHLSEIFGELEKYYTLQQSLRRQFRSQTFLPIVQFVLALLIIALLIFVLGMIASARNAPPMGVFGLRGASGALIFLTVSFGGLALLYIAYRWLSRPQGQKPALDALLLRLPGLGPCLEALVLGRFSLALQLTLDSGMPITQALRLSLQATGNGVYQARAPGIIQALKNGKDLTYALTQSRLFPEDFLSMVATGEEGGRVPEIMRHQAQHYHEEAERRLKQFTGLMSMGVWLLYAVFMVIAIFSIARQYLGALGG